MWQRPGSIFVWIRFQNWELMEMFMRLYFKLLRQLICALAMTTVLVSCTSEIRQHNDEKNHITEVIITPGQNSLLTNYRLQSSVSAFKFAPQNKLQRADSWHVSDDWLFDGETLTRKDEEAFDTFTITLTPEKKFYNRKYFAIDRIGANGWSLYLPVFAAAQGDTGAQFKAFGADAVLRVGSKSVDIANAHLSIDGNGNLLAYVGSGRNVFINNGVVIAGPEIDSAIREKVKTDLDIVVTSLTAGFRKPPVTTPTIYITHALKFSSKGWKGGQMEDGVIALRFRGIPLRMDDPWLTTTIEEAVTHESIHLWIGGLYKNTRNEEESWAHEGTTEYISDRLRFNGDAFRTEAQQTVNRCLNFLANRPLDGSQGYVQGRAAYDCGFTLSLAAELASLQNGNGDILKLWRSVFALDDEDSEYTPQQFLNVAEIAGGTIFTQFSSQFLKTSERQGWENLAESFSALGVSVELGSAKSMGHKLVAKRWLSPLLGSLCTGSYGYYSNQDLYTLDTQERCGTALANDPEVVTIGPYNFITDPIVAFEYVQNICNKRGELQFGLLGGGMTAPVTCNIDIANLPPTVTLTKLPPLPKLGKH